MIPAIEGVLEILRSAAKEPSVKSFVLTSSSVDRPLTTTGLLTAFEFRIAAFMNFMRMKGPEYTLKETDCNDMTVRITELYVKSTLTLHCSTMSRNGCRSNKVSSSTVSPTPCRGEQVLIYRVDSGCESTSRTSSLGFPRIRETWFHSHDVSACLSRLCALADLYGIGSIAPCWVFGPSSQAGITKLSETGSSFGLAFSSLVGIKRLPPTMFDVSLHFLAPLSIRNRKLTFSSKRTTSTSETAHEPT